MQQSFLVFVSQPGQPSRHTRVATQEEHRILPPFSPSSSLPQPFLIPPLPTRNAPSDPNQSRRNPRSLVPRVRLSNASSNDSRLILYPISLDECTSSTRSPAICALTLFSEEIHSRPRTAMYQRWAHFQLFPGIYMPIFLDFQKDERQLFASFIS